MKAFLIIVLCLIISAQLQATGRRTNNNRPLFNYAPVHSMGMNILLKQGRYSIYSMKLNIRPAIRQTAHH